MRQHVEVTGMHGRVTADEAFAVLCELDRHVRAGEVILSLRLEDEPGGTRVSHWETKFRNGILRWSQRDTLDAEARTMTFELCEGDAETLEGTWRIEPAGSGCRISFACDFDLGIPSLADFLDPVAVRLLRESVAAQLTDIFGPELRVEDAPDAVLRAAGPSV